MPRIVHVVPEDGIGGVEVAARTMLNRSDLPVDFRYVIIMGRTFAADKSHVVDSPFRTSGNPLAQLRAVWQCVRLRPDVLIFSLWRSVPAALLARLLLRKSRLVYFLHIEKPAHELDRLFSQLAIRVAHEVWADSEATLQARSRPPGQPSRVISFVINRFSAPERNGLPAPRFVSWCRLSRQKGIDRALQFIALLVRRGIPAALDLWGPDRGEGPALREMAKELGIEDRVHFRGPAERTELPRIASEASFFLQLSRSEGMAIGTVEAMQLGLVPVTTAVGEMGRYVIPLETGIIVDPDRLEAGCDAVGALLADEQAYRRLSEAAVHKWETAPTYGEDIAAAATAALANLPSR